LYSFFCGIYFSFIHIVKRRITYSNMAMEGKSQSNDQTPKFKLILVGDGGVGKNYFFETSLDW